MALTLTLENLEVETFSTSSDREAAVGVQEVKADASENATLYGCTCGCNTYENCESNDPNCTLACVEPSNRTDYIACCG